MDLPALKHVLPRRPRIEIIAWPGAASRGPRLSRGCGLLLWHGVEGPCEGVYVLPLLRRDRRYRLHAASPQHVGAASWVNAAA